MTANSPSPAIEGQAPHFATRVSRTAPPPYDSSRLNWLFPSGERSRARRNRVLAVLALVAAVFLVARAVRKDDGVLARNREFGARFLERTDPYVDPVRGHRVHGPYPPSYVIVTAPLALVSENAARLGWALLQITALACTYVLMRDWTRRGWPAAEPHAPVLFALALLLASRFLLRDMAGGGGNLVYAAAALWGVELALRERALAGGALLALSLVLKPNLAPFVVFLACARRWRAVVACIAVAALLVLAPGLWYGFEAWTALVERWVADLAQFGRAVNLADAREVPDGFPLAETSMNQSVREALWRALSPATAAVLTALVSAALLLVAGVTAARARGERELRAAAALFLPVCLLISPVSWKAHHVGLLALYFVLCAEARSAGRRWLGTLLVVYYGACVLLSEELVGKEWKNTLQEMSIVTLGALALFAAGVVVARRDARAIRAGGGA